MTERKLDAVLYFILAVTALFYLEFTFLNARPVLIMPDSELTRETDLRVDASSITLELASSERSDIDPAGFHIYVDLDVTQMYVYNDGVLVKTYEVSGGKPGSSSPEGAWKIINKDTWGEGFGGAWLGFNVPWGMYGIHGTTEPWFQGKANASKGCIRMKNSDVKELFDMIPYNTTVTIVYKNRPFHPLQDGDVGSGELED